MRVLMCPPDFFHIGEEINCWMDKNRQPNAFEARKEWQRLVSVYYRLGVEIWFIDPRPDCQDMCFTANIGWYQWGRMIVGNFRENIAKVRRKEIPSFRHWLTARNSQLGPLDIISLPLLFPPRNVAFEGQGDVVVVSADGAKKNAIVLMGYGQGRTDYQAAEILKDIHALDDNQVIPLRLVSEKFYHLDTACVFVPNNILLYYPEAFDGDGRGAISSLPVDLIAVSAEDAYNFVCNGVPVEKGGRMYFIVNTITRSLTMKLLERSVIPKNACTKQFIKSGGSTRCLTLVF